MSDMLRTFGVGRYVHWEAHWRSGQVDLRNLMIAKRWLTLSQVAGRLQMDERIIIQYLRDHQLRGFKRDDEWLISAGDLNAFLETCANVPSQRAGHAASDAPKSRP